MLGVKKKTKSILFIILFLGRLMAFPATIVLITCLNPFTVYSQTAEIQVLSTQTVIQEQSVPSGMILTVQSALRGLEGELIPMIGREPRLISPAVWLMSASGSIVCTTNDSVCQHEFRYSQITIGHATDTCKLGVLDIKVENGSKSNADAWVWVAWRYASSEREQVSTRGFLLENANTKQPLVVTKIPLWDPKAIWSFQQADFVRDNEIVYNTIAANGWKRETWVRRLDLPYRDIEESTILGFTCFQQTFVPGAGSSVRILVPYRPLLLQERGKLDSLSIHPSSAPTKPEPLSPAPN